MAKVSKKLRRERLLKLATYLVNLPKNREFDMTTWGEHDGKHKPSEANYCGTSACALGHAAMIPEFKRLGLKLSWYKREDDEMSWGATVSYKGEIDEVAGKEFFGLTYEEADDLFYDTCRDRPQVVARILELAEGESQPQEEEY